MRTRVSVTIATATLGMLFSTAVCSQSRFGRAVVQFKANEKPEKSRDNNREFR